MRNLYPLAVLLCAVFGAYAQNDFRSRQSGDWDDQDTWEEFVGGSWQVTTNTPVAGDGSITIRSPHMVTVAVNATVDQLTVQSGGTVSVDDGVVFTIANGEGTDIVNSGTIVTSSGNELVFLADSEYEHARNGGTIPAATWNAGTVCRITGITNTSPAGLNPTGGFYHFQWACTSQSTSIGLDGELRSIAGNFVVSETNAFNLRLSIASAPAPINVSGDFIIEGDETRVAFATSADLTVNVGGNFRFEATNPTGTLLINASGAGSVDLNIGGDFVMNAPGGEFRITNGSGSATIDIDGNFDLAAGTITESSGGTGSFIFDLVGTQSFVNTGSISNTINYYVGPQTTLDVLDESPLSGTGALLVDGTIRLGSLNATGAVAFGPGGNIGVNNRTFSQGSRIVYAGNGPQFIGNGHPTDAGVITEIDNASGVTFNTITEGNNGSAMTLIIPDDLILTSGNLNVVSNGTPRALSLSGNITPNGNFITFSGSQSDLQINGSGALGTFPFPGLSQEIRHLTMSRTSGSVSFDNELDVTGTLSIASGSVEFNNTTALQNVELAAGTILSFDGADLTINGDFTSTGGGALSAGETASLTLTGGQTLTSPLRFIGTGNILGSLTVNKTNTGISFTVNTSLTIASALFLTDGRIDNVGGSLAVANGATITRNYVSRISNSRPSGGPWHVVYTGGTQSTDFEIPVSGELLSLTVDTDDGSTVTLTQHIEVAGALTILAAGRTFNCGSRNVEVGAFNNSGTFLAPSTNLRLNGDFVNHGTYTHRNGHLRILGDVTMSGTTMDDVRFYDVTIEPTGSLTPSALLLVQGHLTNDGVFNAGTGAVSFRGTWESRILSGTTNTQFYDLDLNKSAAGIGVSVTSPQTVTNNLSLNNGEFEIVANNLLMAEGATITRTNSGSIVTSSPGGGPWNVVYTGTSMDTGLEIPAGAPLMSLTSNMNSGAALTLTGPVEIDDHLTITAQNVGPIFTAGANAVTTGDLNNGGVFNAPTSTLTLTRDFINDRTFNHQSGMVVFGGISDISGTADPVFNHVSIDALASLNATRDFSVQGDFINDGAFEGGNFTITFDGENAQDIGGASVTTFNNLQINNTTASGVRIETDQNLRGVLTLGQNATLDADGTSDAAIFTILSTNDSPAEDGAIAPLPGSAVVAGNITVQRYFGVADDYDRFISSPVTGGTIEQLQQSIPITGKFTGSSSPCSGCGGNVANMWWYDETASGKMQNGYRAIPGNGQSNQEVLIPGEGYDVYMWNGVAPATLNLRGQVNRGAIEFPTLSHTVSPTPNSADGWNLVGNPYPSAIQWNNGAGWEKTNIDPTVWVWDVVGRVWHSYNANTQAGDLTDGVIASGQGFWVYAPSPGLAEMTINEQAKAAIETGAYYRITNTRPGAMRVTLSHGGVSDNAWLAIDAGATAELDYGLDAPKLQLGIERLSISFLEGTRKLGHHAIAPGFEGDIPLSFYGEASGEYKLFFDPQGFHDYVEYYLIDTYLGKTHALANSLEYTFTLTSNAGNGEERFVLSTKPGLAINSESSVRLACYPNPAIGDVVNVEINSSHVKGIALMDHLGRKMTNIDFVTENGITTGKVSMLASRPGVYFLCAQVGEYVVTEKLIKY